MNQTEQLAGKATRTEKAIERLDAVDKPRVPWQLRLDIPTAARSGDVVVRLTGVTVDVAGEFTLGPIDLLVTAGERVALVGANGSGKTTLLNTMLGGPRPTTGTAQLGRSVVVGEIGQARDQLVATGDVTLFRAFQDVTGLESSEARTLLAKFGLVADHVLRTPATLSPGERTRASLAVLMAKTDEPARARRADQPPRPPGDRTARGRPRRVRRHRRARHPRPIVCSSG